MAEVNVCVFIVFSCPVPAACDFHHRCMLHLMHAYLLLLD